MNSSFRPLLVVVFLLVSTLTSLAEHRSVWVKKSAGDRTSIVREYKQAYARPRARRTLFGKRKTAAHAHARMYRRTHRW